jgi:hypothetical protein
VDAVKTGLIVSCPRRGIEIKDGARLISKGKLWILQASTMKKKRACTNWYVSDRHLPWFKEKEGASQG